MQSSHAYLTLRRPACSPLANGIHPSGFPSRRSPSPASSPRPRAAGGSPVAAGPARPVLRWSACRYARASIAFGLPPLSPAPRSRSEKSLDTCPIMRSPPAWLHDLNLELRLGRSPTPKRLPPPRSPGCLTSSPPTAIDLRRPSRRSSPVHLGRSGPLSIAILIAPCTRPMINVAMAGGGGACLPREDRVWRR